MAYKVHDFQLMDMATKAAILASGGSFVVVSNGGFARVTLYDPDNDFAALSQPVSLSAGHGRFAVADTIESVDIYGIAPGQEALQLYGVKAQEFAEWYIDRSRDHFVLEIPFAAADFDAATENDSGFNEPTNALILPNGAGLYIGTVDATETMEVGTDSSDSGDADGFLDALSLATLGMVKPTIANSGNTMGALFEVQDSANAGDLTHEAHVSGGKSITLTPSAGADTYAGKILLPYVRTRLS